MPFKVIDGNKGMVNITPRFRKVDKDLTMPINILRRINQGYLNKSGL